MGPAGSSRSEAGGGGQPFPVVPQIKMRDSALIDQLIQFPLKLVGSVGVKLGDDQVTHLGISSTEVTLGTTTTRRVSSSVRSTLPERMVR